MFNALHFPALAGQQWQIWRSVSHALLHFSVMHIAFNLLWWWQFGAILNSALAVSDRLSCLWCPRLSLELVNTGLKARILEAYPLLSMLWLGICGFLVSAPLTGFIHSKILDGLYADLVSLRLCASVYGDCQYSSFSWLNQRCRNGMFRQPARPPSLSISSCLAPLLFES